MAGESISRPLRRTPISARPLRRARRRTPSESLASRGESSPRARAIWSDEAERAVRDRRDVSHDRGAGVAGTGRAGSGRHASNINIGRPWRMQGLDRPHATASPRAHGLRRRHGRGCQRRRALAGRRRPRSRRGARRRRCSRPLRAGLVKVLASSDMHAALVRRRADVRGARPPSRLVAMCFPGMTTHVPTSLR